MPAKKSFASVGDILEETLKKIPVIETFRVYPIWKRWGEIVGETIAQKTSPDFVRDQTLFVSVSNSVWLHQLTLQKKTFLEKVATLKLDYTIRDIRFRLKK